MNYMQERIKAQDLIKSMQGLIQEIAKTSKASDRKKLRDELDKKDKVLKRLKELKKTYTE